MEQITGEIHSHIDWIGVKGSKKDGMNISESARGPVRLLDCACGTGLASRVRLLLRFVDGTKERDNVRRSYLNLTHF